MGLKLTTGDLRAIAHAVEQLEKVSAYVTEIRVGGVRLNLVRNSDQRDGDWYMITGISNISSEER